MICRCLCKTDCDSHVVFACTFYEQWILPCTGCVGLLRPALPCAAGLAGAWIGLTVQHCGNHGAMSTSPAVNKAMGLTDDLIGGSSLMWRYHHQASIHTCTYVLQCFQQAVTEGSNCGSKRKALRMCKQPCGVMLATSAAGMLNAVELGSCRHASLQGPLLFYAFSCTWAVYQAPERFYFSGTNSNQTGARLLGQTLSEVHTCDYM